MVTEVGLNLFLTIFSFVTMLAALVVVILVVFGVRYPFDGR